MAVENPDSDRLRHEYETLCPRYERLAEEIKEVLSRKLRSANIDSVSLSHRVKQIDSLLAKISRRNLENSLSGVTDLAGVRVVCSYTSDIAAVYEIIHSNFQVHELQDKRDDLGDDKMGYSSVHYTVTLGTRYAGGRYEDITDLRCEIQVRTILQDAWAVFSHQLVYKNQESVPKNLRRDLNTVALLLEVAQNLFDSVNDKRSDNLARIEKIKTTQGSSGLLGQPVDFDTIVAYTLWKFPDLPVSPNITSQMLRDMRPESYPTIREIDAVVNKAKDAVDAYRKENPLWFQFGTDFITKSLGFCDLDFRARHPFALRTKMVFEKYRPLLGRL